MGRVNAHFQRLQPVALEQALEGKHMGVGGDKTVELGEGRCLTLAQVGKHNAGALDHRIGLLLDGIAQAAAFGLGRGLQAVAGHIEQPAVEGAAQAAVFYPAKGQVGTTVWAVTVQHAQLALFIAEQHKVLAHQAHGAHWALARQFIHQRHGLPVAAQQLAGGRLGTDTGHEIILFCAEHGDYLSGPARRCMQSIG